MDKYIVDEMDKDYKYILGKVAGKVVMDIGANLGAFTTIALQNGAKQVIAIEPEQENFDLLMQNIDRYSNSICIKAAVVANNANEITLYVNEGNNKGLHTVQPNWLASSRPDCTKQIVPAININKLLHRFKPEVLKIDIEGGEVLIADTIRNLPKYVKYVAIEFDTISDTYLATIRALLDSKFKDADRNKFFIGERL